MSLRAFVLVLRMLALRNPLGPFFVCSGPFLTIEVPRAIVQHSEWFVRLLGAIVIERVDFPDLAGCLCLF